MKLQKSTAAGFEVAVHVDWGRLELFAPIRANKARARVGSAWDAKLDLRYRPTWEAGTVKTANNDVILIGLTKTPQAILTTQA